MLLEPSVRRGWLTRVKRAVPYLCAALVFLVLCFSLRQTKRVNLPSFWDARIYVSAIHNFLAGSNPYAASRDGLDFVYPPLFLRAGALLAKAVTIGTAWPIYLTLLFLAMFAIPWTLAAVFLRSEWFTPLMGCLLFVFQPKLFAEEALLSGNVASLLYAAILLAAIPGVRRNRWTMFYAAVILAALIKLPFVTLLAFSWLAGNGQFRRCAGSALVVVLAYVAEWSMDHQLFVDFLASVKRQVLDGGDAGLGVLAMFLKMGRRVPVMRGQGAEIACVGVIAGMLAVLYMVKRFKKLPSVAEIWVPMALIATILSNPRMMSYDADIAIVPAVFLFLHWARNLRVTRYRWAWIAIPPTIFLVLFRIGPATASFVLIVGSMVLVLLQVLTKARHAMRAVGEAGSTQSAQLQRMV